MRKSRFFYLFPGDPHHSQNLMESKLDQDPSYDCFFFQEDQTSSICVVLLTNKGTNGNRQTVMQIIPPGQW